MSFSITERTSNWIQVIFGKPFYPLEPRAEEIEITDIAWSLSRQCRYAGHVKGFYSVAEHCVHVSRAVPKEYALWGLLHDASEAYLVDLPRPVKNHIHSYKKMESRLMECVAERFGLSLPEPAIVKEMDDRILFNERQALLNPSLSDWSFTGELIPGVKIYGWEYQEAYEQFMLRYTELIQE